MQNSQPVKIELTSCSSGSKLRPARAGQHERPRQNTLRSPACGARLCPGVLRIVLTTPRSSAAVAFFGGHYGKRLRCGTLATSSAPLRRLWSRSQERIKLISSAPEAQGKVWRSRSRYPLHSFDRTPMIEVNRRRLEPIVQEARHGLEFVGATVLHLLDTLSRSGLACHRGGEVRLPDQCGLLQRLRVPAVPAPWPEGQGAG